MILADSYPPATNGSIVVWGLLARFPFGGVTWQALQYLVGLRRLGFDVWYVEDSDSLLRDPRNHDQVHVADANVRFLARQLKSVGLGNRWVFRTPGTTEIVGALDAAGLAGLYGRAVAVLNICGAQELLPRHRDIRRIAYIQTDPVREQVRAASGHEETLDLLDAYTSLFTYGENLGGHDCLVPETRHAWRPTRPPICLDWWETDDEPRRVVTTVASWRHKVKDVTWKGSVWRWSKHLEFVKVLDLPQHSCLPLELALGRSVHNDEVDQLRERGWLVIDAPDDPQAYRAYLRSSFGEFTVAKEQYVVPRTGWFSDRSACYLAAGRPVITQDTGFEKFIPTGEGLFAFSTLDEAAAAIEAIASDYPRHSAAATEIAREYFDASRVLGRIIEEIGL